MGSNYSNYRYCSHITTAAPICVSPINVYRIIVGNIRSNYAYYHYCSQITTALSISVNSSKCVWCDSSFMCVMTHSCVSWLIHACHDSFMCAMTHSCVSWLIDACHGSFMYVMTVSCVSWLIHVCHDSFMCVMTHSCVYMYPCAMTHDHMLWLMAYATVEWCAMTQDLCNCRFQAHLRSITVKSSSWYLGAWLIL